MYAFINALFASDEPDVEALGKFGGINLALQQARG
jgi:hypothetical protein